MKPSRFILAAYALVGLSRFSAAAVTVTAKNTLALPRDSETIVLQWSDLAPGLGRARPDRVVVKDSAGNAIVAQPIYLHGHKQPADELVFQADFAANQERQFTIEPGMPAPYEPRVYGRWVPERDDDFAWENDRIAYRIYGPLLEKVEPACSGIDVWPKRTRSLIINKWYQLAQSINDAYYHTDHGEGLDCYKVGHGQGCGGTAIWSEGKRLTTGIKGWKTQRVLANGPVRLIFELTYDPINVNGVNISETKRVTLDAGQNLNHYECTFTADKPMTDLTIAVGIGEHTDRRNTKSFHKDRGWMSYWDAGDASPATKDNGHVGCAVIVDPAQLADMVEADDQMLALIKAEPGKPVSFRAGAGWDRSGDFAGVEDWDKYTEQWEQRVESPLQISVSNPK